MQNWRKLGLVFDPQHFGFSYSAVPVAHHIDGDIYRVYFSCRDDQNRSVTRYFTIELAGSMKVLECSRAPVLEPGDLGAFDDSGAMGCALLNASDGLRMYYIGWNLGVTVPFRNSIGVALSHDGGLTFEKMFKGPIVDRTKSEPHFTASCCLLNDEHIIRLWYLSCTGWIKKAGVLTHKYHIKYAESADGVNFDRTGSVAIDFKDDNEYAISVPRVIKEDHSYSMWYSYRGTKQAPTYRIGTATSNEGIHWQREDEGVNLDVSSSGWDSEMLCYPFVFNHRGARYMFYNGNGYGKTGIGLAVLED